METSRKTILTYQTILSLLLLYLGVQFYPHFEGESISYLLLILVFAGTFLGNSVLKLLELKLKERATLYRWGQLFLGMIQNGIILAFILFVYGQTHLVWAGYLFLGTLVQALLYFLLGKENLSEAFAKLITISLIGIAIALCLRLGGIFASILFAVSFLQGAAVSSEKMFSRSQFLARALLFGASLIVCRAFVQQYLVASHYDSLGVVITHPYTFVALCVGMVLPWILSELKLTGILSKIEVLFFVGIVLPVLLGLFIHVRPIAAFALALGAAQFFCGIYSRGPLLLTLVSPLALISMNLCLPYYKEYMNTPRVYRVYVFLTLLVLALIYHLVRNVLFKKNIRS